MIPFMCNSRKMNLIYIDIKHVNGNLELERGREWKEGDILHGKCQGILGVINMFYISIVVMI